MNLSDVLRLKYPDADFINDIIVQDDGNGAYIKDWRRPEPKPTPDNIAEWKQTYDLQYRQEQVTKKRIYPKLEKQLDMIYWDSVNGTTIWKDTISSIKAQFPKPTE